MNNWFYLDCPCTSFPRSFARDYKETYQYPPPSTVYGFLLSLVGEEDLTAHLGVQLAIGLIGQAPPISRILRKQRHHKFSKQHLGTYPTSQFSKPNFQEILTDLKLVLRVDSSHEVATVGLLDRLSIALTTPEKIRRFGGLSLGESWAMINGMRLYRETDGPVRWLIKDPRGLIGLPVWIDRTTTRGIFQRFSLTETPDFDDRAWVTISGQPATKPAKGGRKV
ncbi:CRISPR-associated protein Cas5 [Limnothrix sp. PR1529]|uniref:CRISPR-associated protein Cas5 n=1 Tax=Limnothrix sp. PR1529 TaxID=1704291 RepID=UPI00081DD242|nr:CRISPR-associated protein Cas5 [Limnothrix sp. PR1529]OCQ92071.1 CRISPR-associated protein Cas5 [Limnothrix sp. P13C2]PIB07091.1 CRISPR-associated protein Cas5 [Limnothrix sp. PR1529]